MPEPENTPAPTRRFLPPSSTSSTAKTTTGLPSSVRRNPFQSSSRSTQQPPSASSSSFAAGTPRFQRPTPPVVKDDIQTNFDDEIEATTLSSKTGLIGGDKGGGLLDDLDDDDDEIYHQTLSPLYSRGAHQATAEGVYERHAESDIRSPLQHRLRKSAPEQVAKRRKMSHHPAASSVIEPVATPSSPEDDDHDEEASFQIDAGGSPASQSDLDDNLGRPTAPATVTESNRIARFKPITQGYHPPSLPFPRTVFKQPVREEDHAHAHASVGSGSVLPDIFSPPRRKGKRDYIPGGSASLVRSWVLDIATQESHTESLSEEMLQIAAVERDVSGRFVIVSDQKGQRWLLPEQHERPARRSSSGSLDCWSDLRPGSQVLVKGKATRWSLNLESQGLGSVEVAAYWEPVSPG